MVECCNVMIELMMHLHLHLNFLFTVKPTHHTHYTLKCKTETVDFNLSNFVIDIHRIANAIGIILRYSSVKHVRQLFQSSRATTT